MGRDDGPAPDFFLIRPERRQEDLVVGAAATAVGEASFTVLDSALSEGISAGRARVRL